MIKIILIKKIKKTKKKKKTILEKKTCKNKKKCGEKKEKDNLGKEKEKKNIYKKKKTNKKNCRESFITFPTCFRALLNFLQLCFNKFYFNTYNILTFQMQSYLFLFF